MCDLLRVNLFKRGSVGTFEDPHPNPPPIVPPLSPLPRRKSGQGCPEAAMRVRFWSCVSVFPFERCGVMGSFDFWRGRPSVSGCGQGCPELALKGAGLVGLLFFGRGSWVVLSVRGRIEGELGRDAGGALGVELSPRPPAGPLGFWGGRGCARSPLLCSQSHGPRRLNDLLPPFVFTFAFTF